MEDIAEPQAPPMADAPSFAADAFLVPLTVEIERAEVPLSHIQAVQAGAVLPLAGMAGSLPVRIVAGSRAIATGQIVSIGDGFGVLIDGVTGREG